MCHIENQLEQKSMILSFYRRYVDDILVTMPNTESATGFLQVLNNVSPSLSFTMELEHDGSIPFLGTVLTIKMSWHSKCIYHGLRNLFFGVLHGMLFRRFISGRLYIFELFSFIFIRVLRPSLRPQN